jgi:hypothetical protein
MSDELGAMNDSAGSLASASVMKADQIRAG